MEDLFTILIFLAALWSMIGGTRPKGQRPGGGAKPGGRPARRGAGAAEAPAPRESRPERAPTPAGAWEMEADGRAGTPAAEPPAAEVLIPDDLWEILTGERRRPVLTVPAPEPEPDFEFDFEPDSEPEPDLEPEPVRVDAGRYEETRSPVHAREPDIVSLESEPPPAEIRRAAFHDRLGSTPPLARPRAARRLPPLLANRKGLRQAVVLREVLGPPKGLDG